MREMQQHSTVHRTGSPMLRAQWCESGHRRAPLRRGCSGDPSSTCPQRAGFCRLRIVARTTSNNDPSSRTVRISEDCSVCRTNLIGRWTGHARLSKPREHHGLSPLGCSLLGQHRLNGTSNRGQRTRRIHHERSHRRSTCSDGMSPFPRQFSQKLFAAGAGALQESEHARATLAVPLVVCPS
jgi:hypothetical protein